MLKENFNYRRRIFLRTVLPTFVIPIVLARALLKILSFKHFTLSFIQSLLLYPLSIILCSVLRIQYSIFRQKYNVWRHNAQPVPCVKGRWPGNVDIMWELMTVGRFSYVGDYSMKLFKELGATTMNLRLLWTDQYFTIDPFVIKYMLATGADQFDKGWRSREILNDLFGSGIFNSEGDLWKSHRAMARPFFARERIADFRNFEKHTSRMLEVIDGLDVFDAQDLYSRVTLDVAASLLFNTELDTLSLPLPQPFSKTSPLPAQHQQQSPTPFGSFAHSFKSIQLICLTRFQRGTTLWPLYEFTDNTTLKHMERVVEYLDPIVKSTLEKNRERKDKGFDVTVDDEECSFLEYMASETEDVELIRQQLFNFLIAAHDTSASLLTFVTYLLTQHPEIMHRLREEVLDVCPVGRVPTYDDIRKMKYMRAVLNETLRLYPPVPANVRASLNVPALIPLGGSPSNRNTKPLYIPPDTEVSYGILGMQRRTDLWGPDAETFNPERWLDAERLEKTLLKNPMIFTPFGAGPRICLGQQLVLNEASFLFTSLLQRYKSFELDADHQVGAPPHWKGLESRAKVEKVWPKNGLALHIKGGLWICARKAGTE